jgi:small GTP-binding protein
MFDPESNVREIQTEAFSQSSLTRIVIPRSVTVILAGCFCCCPRLESAEFEPGSQLRCLESRAFAESALLRVTFPEKLEAIGSQCFDSCSSLEWIMFESNSSVSCVDVKAFYDCPVVRVIIPKSVVILGNGCFMACKLLAEVTFESDSQLTTIGDSAFQQCAMAQIVIPRSVEVIGSRSFYGCAKLVAVHFELGSRLRGIGEAAFDGSLVARIALPSTFSSPPQQCDLEAVGGDWLLRAEGPAARIVLVGDFQVGKTSLLNCFARMSSPCPMISGACHTYQREGGCVQIWDTAGQERYGRLAPVYYRNAAAVIAVFDVTVEASKCGLGKWRREVELYTDHPKIFTVGNKCDASPNRPDDLGTSFTSARTGDGVKEIFEAAIASVLRPDVERQFGGLSNLGLEVIPSERAACC